MDRARLEPGDLGEALGGAAGRRAEQRRARAWPSGSAGSLQHASSCRRRARRSAPAASSAAPAPPPPRCSSAQRDRRAARRPRRSALSASIAGHGVAPGGDRASGARAIGRSAACRRREEDAACCAARRVSRTTTAPAPSSSASASLDAARSALSSSVAACGHELGLRAGRSGPRPAPRPARSRRRRGAGSSPSFAMPELGRDPVGDDEADAADVAGEPIRVVAHDRDGVDAVGLVDAHCARDVPTPWAVQEDHDVAHRALRAPAVADARRALRPDALDVAQAVRRRLDDVEDRRRRTRRPAGARSAARCPSAGPRRGTSRCPSADVGAAVRSQAAWNCRPCVRSRTHTPPAWMASPEAIAGIRPTTVARSATPARADAQDGEAALLVVVGDALDDARDELPVRGGIHAPRYTRCAVCVWTPPPSAAAAGRAPGVRTAICRRAFARRPDDGRRRTTCLAIRHAARSAKKVRTRSTSISRAMFDLMM